MKYLPSAQTLKAATRYLLLGGTVFAIGLLWNFPYERFRDRLTRRLTQATGYKIDMERLSPALPVGIYAENARIQGAIIDLELESFRLTLSPISILTYPFRKAISLNFAGTYLGTVWKGSLTIGKERGSMSFHTKGSKLTRKIPLDDVLPMFAGSNLELAGKVTLDTEVQDAIATTSTMDLSVSDGKAVITIADVVIKAPIVKELRFDKIALQSDLQKGKLDIKSIALSGPDVTGTLSGSLKFDPYFPRSQLQLEGKLTFSERTKELKNLVTTFGADSGLRVNENGTMAFRVNGPISPIDRLSIRGF